MFCSLPRTCKLDKKKLRFTELIHNLQQKMENKILQTLSHSVPMVIYSNKVNEAKEWLFMQDSEIICWDSIFTFTPTHIKSHCPVRRLKRKTFLYSKRFTELSHSI